MTTTHQSVFGERAARCLSRPTAIADVVAQPAFRMRRFGRHSAAVAPRAFLNTLAERPIPSPSTMRNASRGGHCPAAAVANECRSTPTPEVSDGGRDRTIRHFQARLAFERPRGAGQARRMPSHVDSLRLILLGRLERRSDDLGAIVSSARVKGTIRQLDFNAELEFGAVVSFWTGGLRG